MTTEYNKTAEHWVVYYKECKNEKQMGLIETIVLEMFDPYREKAIQNIKLLLYNNRNKIVDA